MVKELRELIKRRELLYMLTWRDIKIKYKQSVMGFMWAILMPMLVILSGVVVRFGMAHLSGKPLVWSDVVSVSVKALPWSFFIASIRFSTNSLVANGNLVTKIFFPREILTLSAILSQMFDFFIASSVLAAGLIVARVGSSIFLLWVPCLIALLTLLAITLCLLLSAANLFYRDVKYIVDVFVTFGIFFTPVFYEAKLAGQWEWVLLLNPVAPILEGLNHAIVFHRSPDLPWVLYSACVALSGSVFALKFFKKLEPKFAESI
jgi:lipopolysaccharide transport system permease protein